MPLTTMRQVLTLFALVLASIFIAYPAHSASGRFCKVDHYHSGSGDLAATQSQAKASAARAWASFTAWEYGNQWGNIRLAMHTKYSCDHPTTGWKCTVMAKPCKMAGRMAKVKRYRKVAKKSRRISRRRMRRSYRKANRRSTRRTRTARRIKAKKWSMKW